MYVVMRVIRQVRAVFGMLHASSAWGGGTLPPGDLGARTAEAARRMRTFLFALHLVYRKS